MAILLKHICPPTSSLGVCCQYLRWQADCLIQHFHPFEVAKVLDDVTAATIAIAVAVAIVAATAVAQQPVDIGLVESHFNIHVFNTCKTVW